MKILIKIISALLYFNFVSLAQGYNIYDDNPIMGFGAIDGGTNVKPGFSVGKPSKKQQFRSSYVNPKYQKINNEHVVDSHFKVRKIQSKQTTSTALETGRLITHETVKSKAQRIVAEYRNTEAPKQWQQKTQHQQIINTVNSGPKDIRQITQIPNNTPFRGDYGSKPKDVNSLSQPSNNQQIPPLRHKAVNVDFSNSMKQRNQDAENSKKNQDAARSQRTQNVGRSQRHKAVGRNRVSQDNAFDSKSYVEMNVRKPQMSTDLQQNVKLNSNHRSFSAQDKRQRIPTSMVVDKTLQKANGIAHDHNMQVVSRVLDSMTQKNVDIRHKKGEHVNRETEKHLDTIYEKSKRSVVAENKRKYIGKDKIGKDLRNQHRNSALARIGSHEVNFEQDDTPYAVFYRMNPETLDRQEGFMIMRSLDAENGIKDFITKETSLHTAFREGAENMANNQKYKINGGETLHRKKLKNFSKFRNY